MKRKLAILTFDFFITVTLLFNIFIISEIRASYPGEGEGSWACNHCNAAGGVGATTCSCRVSLLDVIESECSVTVGDGYYACCRTTWSDRCVCLSCRMPE